MKNFERFKNSLNNFINVFRLSFENSSDLPLICPPTPKIAKDKGLTLGVFASVVEQPRYLMRFFAAFTLAETLLTLLIIGVVATITIPSLIQSYKEQEYKTALKKNYSVLSQAFTLVTAENDGSAKGLCTEDTNYKQATCLMDLFLRKLRFQKQCTYSAATGCWAKADEWYYLKGTAAGVFLNSPQTNNSDPGVILQDGAFLSFRSISGIQNCDYDYNGVTFCTVIMLDINGLKSPNTIGKDIFGFYLKENNIEPIGASGDYKGLCDKNGVSRAQMGWGCTAKILDIY